MPGLWILGALVELGLGPVPAGPEAARDGSSFVKVFVAGMGTDRPLKR